jgi:hypothetical protein
LSAKNLVVEERGGDLVVENKHSLVSFLQQTEEISLLRPPPPDHQLYFVLPRWPGIESGAMADCMSVV